MDGNDRAYFDWNATAPLRAEARAAIVEALAHTGNSSSVHAEGRAARRITEKAREQVAALVGAKPRNVIFTSGATEANATALTPAIGGETRDLLLVSAVEHSSVRCGGRFAAAEIVEVAVTRDGVIDLAALRTALAQAKRPLVSVMQANNETGAIQPIREVAQLVHEVGGLLHVDAVQTAGRIACDIEQVGADLLSISSHKLGGPQGVGALILRDEKFQPAPLLRGGGQERGRRAGTESVNAIAGFGAAAAAAQASFAAAAPHMARLRDRMEAALREISPDAVIFSAKAERLPNTTMIAVPGLKAETALIALDLNGVAVSSGSACSSGKITPSHVLTAMGFDSALVNGAIRLSVGWTTTDADLEKLISAWKSALSSLSKTRPSNNREIAA